MGEQRFSLILPRGFNQRDHTVRFISEISDAEEPHAPRGCIAQAWSVAEVLRCWVKTCAKDDPEE